METEILGITGTEWVGYLASLGILSSFLMRDIKKLRVINTLGCFLFVIYGLLLDYSIPIIVTNFAIILINIYYLSKKRPLNNQS